jgi:hypothetical protein
VPAEHQITEETDCPSCGGRGFWDGSGQTCTDCGGEGVAGADIVTRLLGAGHGALADEAAHEIERLRKAIRDALAAPLPPGNYHHPAGVILLPLEAAANLARAIDG